MLIDIWLTVNKNPITLTFMSNNLYKGDLPANLDLGSSIAIDSETMGLNIMRDRLCVVQLSSGDGNAHLIQFEKEIYNAPNLVRVLQDEKIQKIFHFARFDLAVIKKYLGVEVKNVYCTRTASKFARTYTDNHGLKALAEEYLGMDLSKKQQSSYWGAGDLSDKQLDYAANDVLHLHKIKTQLDERLKREGRLEIALKTMQFLPTRAELDLAGWPEDVFAH
jgi:ribonuclease D